MALSDTCSEVSWRLTSDIVHYIDWGYDIKDISKLVDVIFTLASFQVKHDAPFMSEVEQRNGMNRVIIFMFKEFLENTDEKSRILFSEIVQHNQNLNAVLNSTDVDWSMIQS